MTELTERDRLMKLETKLDAHCDSNDSDLNEIKATTVRIETKLDVKANKDDVEKLATIASAKLDHDAILPIKEKIDLLENRVWYIAGGVILSLIGAIISYMIRK